MSRALAVVAVTAAVAVTSFSAPAGAATVHWLVPPVGAPVAEVFDAPIDRWGAGHRGVDFAVAAGTPVTSAAPGRVAFAGPVGGRLFVTVAHGDGLETTYSGLSEIDAIAGQQVSEGTILGRAGEAHPGAPGLHFGVKLHGVYVDPASMFAADDLAGAIRLAPLVWEPPSALAGALAPVRDAGTGAAPCVDPNGLSVPEAPPNDNIAVAVAGIGSSTRGRVSASMYVHGPETLGYPGDRIYRFSYGGIDRGDLHRPYTSTDTFGDLKTASARLRELLVQVGRRHPGRGIDLIAHSQGGVVARTFLALHARSGDPDVPPIRHLVTFATPHHGAPLAGAAEPLRSGTITGATILAGASAWARAGGPVLDPDSIAVAQMAPGSDLMDELATEDVLFGVRSLSLAIPNDAVVPADHALMPGARSHVVPPAGLNGHSDIVRSPDALALAHAFLRGAPPVCPGVWDVWGPRVGRAISYAESSLPGLYGRAESAAIASTPAGGVGLVWRAVDGVRRWAGDRRDR